MCGNILTIQVYRKKEVKNCTDCRALKREYRVYMQATKHIRNREDGNEYRNKLNKAVIIDTLNNKKVILNEELDLIELDDDEF